MGFGLLNFVILFAIVWHKKFCDAATPNLTLTGKSELIVGENLTLTCAVNQDVDLLSVSFFREIIETIWISNPLPTPCTFYNLIPDDNSTYSTTCDPSKRNFTMTKYNLDTSDDNTVWFCQMKSVPGGNGTCVGTNNSCTSGNVTIHVSVKPSSSAPSTPTTSTVTAQASTSTFSMTITSPKNGDEDSHQLVIIIISVIVGVIVIVIVIIVSYWFYHRRRDNEQTINELSDVTNTSPDDSRKKEITKTISDKGISSARIQ